MKTIKQKKNKKRINNRQTLKYRSSVQIANILKPITKEQSLKSWNDLQMVHCINNTIAKKALLSFTGIAFVDYYTFSERIQTKGNHYNLSFVDIYNKFDKLTEQFGYLKKTLLHKMPNFYTATSQEDEKKRIRALKEVADIYFGGISIFRPLIAKDIYCRYRPNTVLDMTMGWGGRLVGACSAGVPHYIGIDLNHNLIEPYRRMVADLTKLTPNTKITILFKDALKIDYSKFDYDMVFTSPPYYTVETYSHSNIFKNKQAWNTDFYIPLFSKTWLYLKNGGYYCLNVPIYLYNEICIPLWGKADKKIPLIKRKRSATHAYNIYG